MSSFAYNNLPNTLLPRTTLEKELVRQSKKDALKPNISYVRGGSDIELEQDKTLLQNFRQQLLNKAVHAYRQNHCFRNYNEFIRICSSHIRHTELDFKMFQCLQSAMPNHLKRYFTAKAFLFLRPTNSGIVPTEDFLKYMERCLSIEEYLLTLFRYAAVDTSNSISLQYLNSQQLCSYLIDYCLPLLDPFQHIAESFTEFYAATTALKFQFYLDERNKNMISIRHIAHSDVMLELQSLVSITRFLHSDDNNDIRVIGYNIHDHPEALKRKMESNWFSPYRVTGIYQTFLNLDQDMNGLLSLEELTQFSGFHKKAIRFTTTACKRLLEYLITYNSIPLELDYKGFVQIVLALDDINNPNMTIEKGLKFFWKLIDFDQSGILTYDKIQFFYRDIVIAMRKYYQTSLPSCDIIVQEIFDLVNYHPDAHVITEGRVAGPDWEFIRKSDQAKTLIMMLLDVETFYRYEFRESLAGAPEEEEEPPFQTHIPSTLEHNDDEQQHHGEKTDKGKSKFSFSDFKFTDEESYEEDYEFD